MFLSLSVIETRKKKEAFFQSLIFIPKLHFSSDSAVCLSLTQAEEEAANLFPQRDFS